MVSLTKLAEFHLFSTCLPQPGNVKWSVDSQVAVVSRKGISLFEFLPDPGIGRESFKIFKTVRAFISISQVKIFKVNPGFANPEDVFGGTKHQVFSLLQDKILTPKGYEKKGVQYHNFFSKVEWSNNPIYVASHGPPKCLLGALTTNLQLYIFCHNNIPYGNKRRRYKLRINLTELYNKELLSLWSTLEKLDFDQYEKRLKELAIVDFCWISLWDEVNYNFNSESPVYETGLLTCHANGDICIWRIYCPTDNAYFTKLIFKKEVLKDEIIRSVKFHKVSSDLAIIVLGTNSGIVKLYRLSKQVPIHMNLTEFFSPLTGTYEYTIDDGIEIWEKDFLQIDMIKMITTVNDENNTINFTPSALKTAKKFDVLVLKHPNFLISFTVWVAEQHNIVLEINHIQIPQSPIMGIVHRVKGQFILCHEQGATSIVTLKNGLVSYFEESLQIFRIQQSLHYSLDRQRYKRFFYYGMDISPNRAMICVCRHLGNHFDHKMKTPGKVEFYSLLTHNDPTSTWKTVKELYEKCYNLERIADALQVLRYEFKRFDHLEFDWLKTEESYKDMYVEDIQFYYWCLRALYRADIVRVTRLTNIADPRAQVLLKNSVDLMKHIKDVQDHLVECNCITLVEKITKNPENPSYILNSTNERSLTNIQKYLSEKDVIVQKAVSMPREVPSECPLCSKPVSYRSNPNDMTSGTILQCGYLWNELVCSDFHADAEVCILSLIPIDEFPTRVCTYCQVSCLAEPSFGQKPRCILCGTMMYLDMPITEFDDVPREYVESDADESLEKKARKGEGDSDDEGLISDSDNNFGSNSEGDSGQDDSDDDD